MIAYLTNVGAGLSHLLNAIFRGSPSHSLSARVGAQVVKGKRWAKVVAWVIDHALFSRNHCIEHAREEGLT